MASFSQFSTRSALPLLLCSSALFSSVLSGHLNAQPNTHKLLRRQVDYFEYDGKRFGGAMKVKRTNHDEYYDDKSDKKMKDNNNYNYDDKSYDNKDDYKYDDNSYDNGDYRYDGKGGNYNNDDYGYGYEDGGDYNDVDCPDLLTSSFGEFFTATATAVGNAVQATGDPSAGIGFNVVSSFLTSDIVTDGGAQAQETGSATVTAAAAEATLTTSPAVSGKVVQSGNTGAGIGFNVISTGFVGSSALAEATPEIPSDADNSVKSDTFVPSATSESTASEATGSASVAANNVSLSATSTAASFVPTTTGIGVVQMGFETVSTFTAANETGSSASDSTGASTAGTETTSTAASESSAASAEQANASVVIPGQKL